MGQLKPCCENNPVDCEDNFITLRSRSDVYAVAIPLSFKYYYEAHPFCQKGAL